jgi:hypothetical protein
VLLRVLFVRQQGPLPVFEYETKDHSDYSSTSVSLSRLLARTRARGSNSLSA